MPKKKTTNRRTLGAAAVLALRCFTDPNTGEYWKSKIKPSTDDGQFLIEREDAFGYFKGVHLNSRERIYGRCSEGGIWFVRPDFDPKYLYKGRFVEDKKLDGTRTTIPTFAQLASNTKAVVSDEWEADKTT